MAGPYQFAAAEVAPTKGAAAAAEATPAAAEGTPIALPTQAAPAADSPCGKAIGGLLDGNADALKSLSTKQREAIVGHGTAAAALSCLAVGDDKNTYCNVLPKGARENCLNEWQVVHDLKAQPPDAPAVAFVAAQLHRQCMSEFPQAGCDALRDAVGSDDATKCKGVPKELDGLCVALATGNESKCPDGDSDCRKMTAAVTKVEKHGLAGFEYRDPILASAAKNGRGECKPLLDELARRCAGQE